MQQRSSFKATMTGKRDASTRYTQMHPTTHTPVTMQRRFRLRNMFEQNQSFIWMILSLISGAAFTVGHHALYASFNDLSVDKASLNQTWVIRIGTGLAFVAKTLLIVAVSIAFTQQQWFTLSSKPFKIRQIDTLTNILGNALCFTDSRIWLRFPLITVSAAFVW